MRAPPGGAGGGRSGGDERGGGGRGPAERRRLPQPGADGGRQPRQDAHQPAAGVWHSPRPHPGLRPAQGRGPGPPAQLHLPRHPRRHQLHRAGSQQEGGEAQGGRGGPEAAQSGGGHAGAPGAQLSFPPGAPRRARPRRAPPGPRRAPPLAQGAPPGDEDAGVPPPGRVQPRGGSAGAGGAEGLAPARVHGDAGVGASAPQGVHHDVPSGEIRGDRQRHLQEVGQAQRGRQDAGEDPQRPHGAARRQRGRGRGGPVQHDVPPAGGAAGPRPRLHLGLAAQLGGREAGPAAEPRGQPRSGGSLRPPAGALGGAELRHQLPRHRRAEPQRAAPVPGGAVHAADHGVPRSRPVPRRRPRPGGPQRAAVPAHHGRGQVSPPGATEPCPGATESCPGQPSPARGPASPAGHGHLPPDPPGSARTSGHDPHPRPPSRPRCGWTDRRTSGPGVPLRPAPPPVLEGPRVPSAPQNKAGGVCTPRVGVCLGPGGGKGREPRPPTRPGAESELGLGVGGTNRFIGGRTEPARGPGRAGLGAGLSGGGRSAAGSPWSRTGPPGGPGCGGSAGPGAPPEAPTPTCRGDTAPLIHTGDRRGTERGTGVDGRTDGNGRNTDTQWGPPSPHQRPFSGTPYRPCPSPPPASTRCPQTSRPRPSVSPRPPQPGPQPRSPRRRQGGPGGAAGALQGPEQRPQGGGSGGGRPRDGGGGGLRLGRTGAHSGPGTGARPPTPTPSIPPQTGAPAPAGSGLTGAGPGVSGQARAERGVPASSSSRRSSTGRPAIAPAIAPAPPPPPLIARPGRAGGPGGAGGGGNSPGPAAVNETHLAAATAAPGDGRTDGWMGGRESPAPPAPPGPRNRHRRGCGARPPGPPCCNGTSQGQDPLRPGPLPGPPTSPSPPDRDPSPPHRDPSPVPHHPHTETPPRLPITPRPGPLPGSPSPPDRDPSPVPPRPPRSAASHCRPPVAAPPSCSPDGAAAAPPDPKPAEIAPKNASEMAPGHCGVPRSSSPAEGWQSHAVPCPAPPTP